MLSADTENDTDVLAITGASAALALSDIPFQKTIAGVRVGLVEGQFVINPTFEQRKAVSSTSSSPAAKDGLVMVEAGAKEVSEEQVVGALEAAHAAIKQLVAAIDEMAAAVGKKKVTVAAEGVDAAFAAEVESKVFEACRRHADSRQARKLRDGRQGHQGTRRVVSGRSAREAPMRRAWPST